ncbi:NfeD family protein [Marinomonas piezotolerans]|uniref:NfeD family protein n=1 Tax=Marinomonas piezotolerans TaxID=2213058 RepID=A0A370UBL9_9GAMM|nr:NfeD family protein [Marinomonas piezotolerans]RDL45182.1 NfeD family protein [Marinomonas piezotolerans]
MNFIATYLVEALAILGLVLLAIEVLVLGISTFVLLFAGLGLLLTSLSMYMEWIPTTWQWALIATTIFTLLTSIVLWPIMKRAQQTSEHKTVNSDLIGHTFVLPEDVAPDKQVTYRFSGIEWRLISSEPIAKSTQVEVVNLQVGELFIQAKETP